MSCENCGYISLHGFDICECHYCTGCCEKCDYCGECESIYSNGCVCGLDDDDDIGCCDSCGKEILEHYCRACDSYS